MPQATDELRAKFSHDDDAWSVLQANFIETRGVIHKRKQNYNPTYDEYDAIDYLCQEWDYDYRS